MCIGNVSLCATHKTGIRACVCIFYTYVHTYVLSWRERVHTYVLNVCYLYLPFLKRKVDIYTIHTYIALSKRESYVLVHVLSLFERVHVRIQYISVYLSFFLGKKGIHVHIYNIFFFCFFSSFKNRNRMTLFTTTFLSVYLTLKLCITLTYGVYLTLKLCITLTSLHEWLYVNVYLALSLSSCMYK